MNADQTAAMTTGDHQRGFGAAIAALLAEFNAYLAREDADPLADSVSYKQFSLWLNDEEKAAFIEEVVGAIRSRMDQGPGPHRRRHLLSTIFFPTETRAALPEGSGPPQDAPGRDRRPPDPHGDLGSPPRRRTDSA
jgi:hypothetical protein